MNRNHLKETLAVIGFIIVVVVLLTYSAGALAVLWGVNDQANNAIHIQDIYGQAHYLARAEDALADEYYLNPGLANQEEYFTNANELTSVLHTLMPQSDQGNQIFLVSLLKLQELYVSRATHYFILVDQRSRSARSFYNESVDPLAAQINAQLLGRVKMGSAKVFQTFAQLRAIQQLIIISFVSLFTLGLAVLAFCGKSIRRYRRDLAHVKQAAWEQMEQMARTDPLTGLPNHQITIERLDTTLAACQNHQQSCALLFVDLDHFKQMNDRWGHQAGDEILCEVARRLQSSLRPEDMIGRYGGEEFVIVLPQTDLPQAKRLGERVCGVLASPPWIIRGQNISVQEPTVTASVGVAVFRLHGTTTAALLEAADSAMYQAKHSGRNCVRVASHISRRVKDFLEEDMQRLPEEVMAFQALAAVANAHDGGISAHGHRLAGIARATAARLHCTTEECHLVRLAAILHDIGKIGIPDIILHKPCPLTDEEWKIMHQHPLLGHQILVQVGGVFRELATLVVAHHERWKGNGYPLGLAGQAIPLGARILAVVDAYDAMTSLRVYRQPLSEDEARSELLRGSGDQFDPQVVQAFLEQLDEERVKERQCATI